MILFDTTVLVYALGADHPLREPARALLELARDGLVRATTTVEVVQEFTHVRSRRRGRYDAATLARDYAVGLSPLLRPDEEDLLEGLELFRGSEALGPFDAVLAASGLRRAWAIVSADRAFGSVDGLCWLDLSSASLLEEARRSG